MQNIIAYSMHNAGARIEIQDIVYISGKMSGLAGDGHARFNSMERILKRDVGCKVLNPARNFGGATTGHRWSEYMRKDIAALCKATAVVALDNWKRSRGARLELIIAHNLEIPIYNEMLVPIRFIDELMRPDDPEIVLSVDERKKLWQIILS